MADSSQGDLETLVRQLLDRQSESRSLDYKGSISFGPGKQEKGDLLKDVIALSNTRDGGYILVGVEQNGGKFIPRGVTAEQAGSFDPTKIGQFAKNHFSLLPKITSHVVTLDGVDLLLLRVEEFDSEPIVCTKDLHDDKGKILLRAGSIYVRTADAQSVAIESGESMRGLLDLAVQKRGDALLTQIRGLVGAPAIVEAGNPSDAYHAEIRAAGRMFLNEELINPHNAYWYVEILPKDYDKDRIESTAQLRDIRRESTVSIRGWDFPHVNNKNDQVFEQGIQSATHFDRYQEAHRFYRSGLFTWRRQLAEDLSEQYAGALSYVSTIYSITEYFIFASRYAPLIADSGNFIVRIRVTGLKDRTLRSLDPGVFLDEYSTAAERFDRSYDLSIEELRTSHLEFAADAARRLFDLYGLEVSTATIKTWQTKFINRQF